MIAQVAEFEAVLASLFADYRPHWVHSTVIGSRMDYLALVSKLVEHLVTYDVA